MSRRWGRGCPAAGIVGSLPNLVPLQEQGESSRIVEIRVDVISPEQYPSHSRSILPNHAPVAQLDRVLASEAKGHRFESCRARQIIKTLGEFGYWAGFLVTDLCHVSVAN